MSQLERLQKRGALLIRAMTLFYSALGGFVTAGLVSLVGAVLASTAHPRAFQVAALGGLVIGTLAVAAVAIGCAFLVRETRLAVRSLNEEADLARARWQAQDRKT